MKPKYFNTSLQGIFKFLELKLFCACHYNAFEMKQV